MITGAFDGGRDQYWFRKHLPTQSTGGGSGDVHRSLAGDLHARSLGPQRAPTCCAKIVTPERQFAGAAVDVSQAGFPYGSVRDLLIDGIPCTLFRISYVGENGWEIYTRMEHGLRLWDTVAAAGEEFGIVPVGIGVYAVTGRIEKGYRLMGAELESEYDPVEAGLARPRVKSADFIGKDAYLAARADADANGAAATLCTLTIDGPDVGRAGIPRATRPVATNRSSRSTASASSTARAACPGSRRPAPRRRSTPTC